MLLRGEHGELEYHYLVSARVGRHIVRDYRWVSGMAGRGGTVYATRGNRLPQEVLGVVQCSALCSGGGARRLREEPAAMYLVDAVPER